jgi:cytidyltransferase-like protein
MSEIDWINIWENREFDKNISYNYNGYEFLNEEEYFKFIGEICKELKIKNNSNILDICCGNGTFMNNYLKINNITDCNVYGIDISKENINYANLNYTGNYIISDFKNKLPFDDNFFDSVVIISSIQYLKNDDEFIFLLNEMLRVAKKDGIIFIGNNYDDNLCDKEILNKNHYAINRNFLFKFFEKYNIKCYDNKYLDIEFYKYQKYKFNTLINLNNDIINLGVDIHDTLTYNPLFFKNLFKNWRGKKILISGTPYSKKEEINILLNNINFKKNVDYDDIEYGYEYKKENMDYSHFEKMKIHKLECIRKHNISIYFDDNPFYVNYLKDFNITVFQTILSNKYIDFFNRIDKYFTCNLQERQFEYISHLKKKEIVYIPGCFDLFHIGHLNLLNKYKNYDIIVGVQSSASIFLQKNKYPVLSDTERVNFIKNLKIVKDVIIYSDIDQSEILKINKINIFIIGPEYGNHYKHNITLDFCKNNNILVKVEERTQEISTTDIISRINKPHDVTRLLETGNNMINIGFIIPSVINLPSSSLLNIYNFMIKNYKNVFNCLIITFDVNFFEKYKNEYNLIYAYDNDNKIINFYDLNLLYTFFLTPYQSQYDFDIKTISNATKIIYVSYGFNTWGVINDIVFNNDFFENVYMSFHETDFNRNDFLDYAKESGLKYFNTDNAFVSGCPKIDEQYFDCKNDFKIQNDIKILYNVRWSNDVACTVDIFMESIKNILNNFNNITIIFRPHPLMNEYVDDFIKNINHERFNISISDNYTEDFLNCDILISDASSFMSEFLATGKPIIYTHKIDIFNSISKIFEEGYYKVSNPTEFLEIIYKLVIEKNDYKYETRTQLVNKYFKIYDPCKIICETIHTDYLNSNVIFNINDSSSIYDNNIAKWYNFTGFTTDRPYLFYKYIDKFCKNINSILEFGCGHCESVYKYLLDKKNIIYTGIDIDNELLKKNINEFNKNNIQNYNFIHSSLISVPYHEMNKQYDLFVIGGYGDSIDINLVLQTINNIKPEYFILETHINRFEQIDIIEKSLIESEYTCICNDMFKAHSFIKLTYEYTYLNRRILIFKKIYK